jgi:hypothetical protein
MEVFTIAPADTRALWLIGLIPLCVLAQQGRLRSDDGGVRRAPESLGARQVSGRAQLSHALIRMLPGPDGEN